MAENHTLMSTTFQGAGQRINNNTKRPHSALGYRPPAPVTIAPLLALDGTIKVQ